MYSAKSSGNNTLSCNVGSTRFPPECPWIALKHRNCLQELRFKQQRNLFSGPPPFARKIIQASTDHCEVPSDLALNFSARTSILAAPSSSRGTDSSCRYNLTINFDTSKQPWLYAPGLTSIHFRSRRGMETRDNVKASFGRGLTFATSFPVPLFSTLVTGISSDVSVTYLLIPFTMRTQETVLSPKKKRIRSQHQHSNVFDDNRLSHPGLGRSSCFHGSILSRGMLLHFEVMCTVDIMSSCHEVLLLHQVSLMKVDRHIQDWADIRASTNPPSHAWWFFTSK